MGLDNGVIIKMKDGKEPPKFADTEFHEEGAGEILYWRKCWGLREAFLNVLDPKNINEFHYQIEAEDIPALIRALRPFFSKEYWEENAESIWEFDEMFERLIDNVINLSKLKEFMEEHADDIEEVYFYDSY